MNCNKSSSFFDKYYDDFKLAINVEDYRKVLEIDEDGVKNVHEQVENKINLLDDDCESGIMHLNKESCCFYKYSHNLPHSHFVVSKSIQCGDSIGNDMNLNNMPKNSNNHNISQSCNTDDKNNGLSKDMDFNYSSKLLEVFNRNLPTLRDSKKYSNDCFDRDLYRDVFESIQSDEQTDLWNLDHVETDNLKTAFESDQNIEVVEISETYNQFNENPTNLTKDNTNSNKEFFDEFLMHNKNNTDHLNNEKNEEIGKHMKKSKMEEGFLNTQTKKISNNNNNYYLAEPISDRNLVRGKYCSTKIIKQRFFLTENSNIEHILQDPSDRRIKATCDRFNCDINVYSKIIKNGYLKNIVVLSAPSYDNLRKCVRSLDSIMGWCLYSQLNG